MRTYKVVQKGQDHPNYCEDFLLDLPVSRSFYVGAVIDGCASGYDSQFAAAFYAKILRKIILQKPFHSQQSMNLAAYGKQVMLDFSKELRSQRRRLQLAIDELLATFILLMYSKALNEVFILVSGNGVLCIDGDITEIKARSEWDYLAYHLSSFCFDRWFYEHCFAFQIAYPKDISISTNGVSTIYSPHLGLESGHFDLIHYLFIDDTFDYMPTMLQKKFSLLSSEYSCTPQDDIAILRIKF